MPSIETIHEVKPQFAEWPSSLSPKPKKPSKLTIDPDLPEIIISAATMDFGPLEIHISAATTELDALPTTETTETRETAETGEPSRDARVFCKEHFTKDRRRRNRSWRPVECKRCQASVKTIFCHFTVCEACSRNDNRCMICGTPVKVMDPLPGLMRSLNDPPFEEMSCPLSDINFIVIGTGDLAKEVFKRRWSLGGRVLLLWTERGPSADIQVDPEADDSDSFTLRPGKSYQLERAASTDSHTSNKSMLHKDIEFDMSLFYWNPPSQTKPTENEELHRLRKEYNCWTRGLCRVGPDIVELDINEQYEVITNPCGDAVGVRVWKPGRGIVWEMSGIVAFAGEEFDDKEVPWPVYDCTEKLEDADFSIECAEVLPISTVSRKQVAVSSLWYLAQMVIFLSGMNWKESSHSAGQFAWWRMSFGLGCIWFGFGVIPSIWGHALTGLEPSMATHMFCGCVTVIAFSVFSVVELDFLVGDTWRGRALPSFTVCVLGTVTYLGICIPFEIFMWQKAWKSRGSRSSLRRLSFRDAGLRKFAWLNHLLWFLWLLLGSFGSWIIMYMMALFYIWIAGASPLVANLALPFMTSGVEMVFAKLNGVIYENVIYKARVRANSGKGMWGDQKQHVSSVMMFTHAYAEATRIVSLLAGVAIEPNYSWLYAFASSFTLDVLQRSGTSTLICMKLFPCFKNFFMLNSSLVMHMECRFLFGYPRFIILVAFVIARLLVWGTSKHPLFNNHSLGIVLVGFFLELLSDIIVLKELLFELHPWKEMVAERFQLRAALNPKQICAIDCQGAHVDRIGLAFHGMHFLKTTTVVGVMAPTTYFCYALITLLLGAGYAHGVCPNPIPGNLAVLDGLVWDTPLRCG